jgi:hypothetical protein
LEEVAPTRDIANPDPNDPKNNLDGVQDFGTFAEGSCFKIVTMSPSNKVWVICTDTEVNSILLIIFIFI